MLGYLTTSDHQMWCYATEDAVRIVNPFIAISHLHVTTITDIHL
jgi:hypothetical protein